MQRIDLKTTNYFIESELLRRGFAKDIAKSETWLSNIYTKYTENQCIVIEIEYKDNWDYCTLAMYSEFPSSAEFRFPKDEIGDLFTAVDLIYKYGSI